MRTFLLDDYLKEMSLLFDYESLASFLQTPNLPVSIFDFCDELNGSGASLTPLFECSTSTVVNTKSNFTMFNVNVVGGSNGLLPLIYNNGITYPPPQTPGSNTLTLNFNIPEDCFSTPLPDYLTEWDQVIAVSNNGFSGPSNNGSNVSFSFQTIYSIIQFYQYSSGAFNKVGSGVSTAGGILSLPLGINTSNSYDISLNNGSAPFNFDFAAIFTFTNEGKSSLIFVSKNCFFPTVQPAFLTPGSLILPFVAVIDPGVDSDTLSSIYWIPNSPDPYPNVNSPTFVFTTPSQIGELNAIISSTLIVNGTVSGQISIGWLGTVYVANTYLNSFNGNAGNGNGSIFTFPYNINNSTVEKVQLQTAIGGGSTVLLSDLLSSDNLNLFSASVGSASFSGSALSFQINISSVSNSIGSEALFTSFVPGASSILEAGSLTWESNLIFNINLTTGEDVLLKVTNPTPLSGNVSINGSSSFTFSSSYVILQFYKFDLTTSPVSLDVCGRGNIGLGNTLTTYDISSTSAPIIDYDFVLLFTYQDSNPNIIQISLLSPSNFNLITSPGSLIISDGKEIISPALFNANSSSLSGIGGEVNYSSLSSIYAVESATPLEYTTNILSAESTTLPPAFIFSSTNSSNIFIANNALFNYNNLNYSCVLTQYSFNAYLNSYLFNSSGSLSFGLFT